MSEAPIQIEGTGVLDVAAGHALRVAQSMDKLDLTADIYRITIASGVTGFGKGFLIAFLAPTLGQFIERLYAENPGEGFDFDTALLKKIRLNSIKGEAEATADLTSSFIHELKGIITGIVGCRQELQECMSMRPDRRERFAAPARRDLHKITGLEIYAR